MTLQNPLKQLAAIFCFCCAIGALQSCGSDGDDDPSKDSQSPEVSFSNLSEDAAVWNEVAINVDATDNAGIKTVELYVDGNLVSTLNKSPYNFTWNSQDASEGEHIVKVVATDESGNKVEKTIKIRVANTLVTYTIAADQLYHGNEEFTERGFVFLSDENGNLIAFDEYENGETVSLKASDFNGEKFYLTEVLYSTEADWNGDGLPERYSRAWTYAEVQRGKNWSVFYEKTSRDPEYAGEAKLTFTNPATGYYSGTTNGDNVEYNESWSTEAARLIKSPSLLYLVRNNDGAKTYNLFSNVVVGNNTINLASVNKALTTQTVNVPEGIQYISSELTAFPSADDKNEPYYLGDFYRDNEESSTYKILYPGNAFASYYVETFMENEEMYYSNGGSLTNFSLPQITPDVDFTFSNGKLNYTAAGNFDFLTTRYTDNGESDDEAYWFFVLPKSVASTSIPTLEIPEALEGINLPGFGLPREYTAHEFASIESYEGLLDFARASESGIDAFNKPATVYTDISYPVSSSNGRRAKAKVNRVKSFYKSLVVAKKK